MLNEIQKQQRLLGIGGTDSAAILGWNKYKTAFDVWNRLVNKVEQVVISDAAQRGIDLEPHVLNMFKKEYDRLIYVTEETHIHKNYNFIIGNIDALIIDKDRNEVLEIKTTANDSFMNMKSLIEHKTWLCQVAHYCNIVDAELAYVYVYHVKTKKTKLYTYHADKAFQDALLKKEVAFYSNYVKTQSPPPVKTVEDAKKTFVHEDGTVMEASNLTKQLLLKLSEIKAKEDELKQSKESIQLDLFLEMASAAQIIDENGNNLATWKTVKRNILNQKLLKQNMPDIYESYLSESESRVFRPNYKNIGVI